MKIIVFGATGFIGPKLCAALEAKGHRVVKDDIRRGHDWKTEIASSDVVVNLAGAPLFSKRWTDAVKSEIHASRVEGTRVIVEAMAAARAAGSKVSALVNASAIGYYGPHFDDTLTEDAPSGTDFLAFVCREWEEAAWVASQRYGIRTVMVRTGIVLGKDGGALQQMLPPFRAFIGGPVASGKQWMSWIHIDDEIGLYILAIENSQMSGPLNATAPAPARNKEFSKALGHAIHRPSLLPIPGVGLYALFGEVAEVLINGQKVLPEKALKAGYVFKFPELQPALKDLLG